MHPIIARLRTEQVKFIREAISVLKTIEKIRHAMRPDADIKFSTRDQHFGSDTPYVYVEPIFVEHNCTMDVGVRIIDTKNNTSLTIAADEFLEQTQDH